MNYQNEKLQNFTKTVMKEAIDKRQEIINKSQEESNQKLVEKENELLEQAYNKIQHVIRKTSKEKNEKISRAILDSRKTLFFKRQEITQQLFNNIKERIDTIKENDTDKYKDFLIGCIEKELKEAGEGEIIVFIDKNDAKFRNDIKEILSTKYSFTIDLDEEKILGGCRVINKNKDILIDSSLENKLKEQRKKFLKISGLEIQ